ncbi:hypothetical protein OIU34_14940 [Pararhizobium sp. BT-229]|uniref:hypothetical protein n=1 Tax=Pararhizobium sp. BT-229 TaxID=2986923 RepID=UPI0021F6CEA6|nr:hypothetical protein [Pararhizobium sp. BT-229]MCV9963203.1 hypothetical protein [Pararhizobium sp. BT-229]
MDSLVKVSTETEEFNTIARMLAYIRDSARQLEAPALEYCIEMAMKAVSTELNSRQDAPPLPPEFEMATRKLQ